MSRSALVTGASRGIGEAIARRLADQGYDLTISARGIEQLHTLADQLQASTGVKVLSVATDMSSEADVLALADAHLDAHGGVDVVVLSAGMGAIGPFADYPARRLDKMFAINVRSAYVLVQALIPALRHSGEASEFGGKVLAIASMTGVAGEPLNSAYGATKAALISLCETINTEESAGGVVATAICPGYVATAMTEGLESTVPQSTMLPVADVANATVALTALSKRTVVPQLILTRPGEHLWRA